MVLVFSTLKLGTLLETLSHFLRVVSSEVLKRRANEVGGCGGKCESLTH